MIEVFLVGSWGRHAINNFYLAGNRRVGGAVELIIIADSVRGPVTELGWDGGQLAAGGREPASLATLASLPYEYSWII